MRKLALVVSESDEESGSRKPVKWFPNEIGGALILSRAIHKRKKQEKDEIVLLYVTIRKEEEVEGAWSCGLYAKTPEGRLVTPNKPFRMSTAGILKFSERRRVSIRLPHFLEEEEEVLSAPLAGARGIITEFVSRT